jgi:glycolate oxidase
MPLPAEVASQVKAIVGAGCYLDSPSDRASYGFNSYPLHTEPAAVVLFEHREHIERVIPLLYERGVPMVIRGAGTNISGSALAPTGGVVLSLERMKRILEVDTVSRYARVEAGASVKEIQDLAASHGLLFPPNPGNVDAVTVGGIIGCNSSGDLALGYGITRDFVLGIEVVTGEGRVLKLGSRVKKDVTGYDLVSLFVGSEGTLGAVVEATLRFVMRPQAEASVLASFGNQQQGAEAALRVLAERLDPVAFEYMDEPTTRAVETAFSIGFPAGARSSLLAKFHGTASAVDAEARRCAELLTAEGAVWTRLALDGQPAEHVWRARHLAYPALARRCPTLYGEDVVVPVRHFPAAVARFHELAQTIGVPIAVFAHAGDGHIHPILLTDDSDPDQRARSDRFIDAIVQYSVEHGGAITGEHGLGVHKTRLVDRQYGEAERDAMKRVKLVFDPKGLFNPVIFPVTGHAPENPRRKGVEIV